MSVTLNFPYLWGSFRVLTKFGSENYTKLKIKIHNNTNNLDFLQAFHRILIFLFAVQHQNPLSSTHLSVPHQKPLSSKTPVQWVELRDFWCWTEGFFVWNWELRGTEGFFLCNWGIFGLELRVFWWGTEGLLNWGVFGVELKDFGGC